MNSSMGHRLQPCSFSAISEDTTGMAPIHALDGFQIGVEREDGLEIRDLMFQACCRPNTLATNRAISGCVQSGTI